MKQLTSHIQRYETYRYADRIEFHKFFEMDMKRILQQTKLRCHTNHLFNLKKRKKQPTQTIT